MSCGFPRGDAEVGVPTPMGQAATRALTAGSCRRDRRGNGPVRTNLADRAMTTRGIQQPRGALTI